jgi:hypothetical protein
MAEMVAHIDTKSSPMKVRFFNTRLEMFIFLNGGEIKDYDCFDCTDIFIGDDNVSLKTLCESLMWKRTSTTQILL